MGHCAGAIASPRAAHCSQSIKLGFTVKRGDGFFVSKSEPDDPRDERPEAREEVDQAHFLGQLDLADVGTKIGKKSANEKRQSAILRRGSWLTE